MNRGLAQVIGVVLAVGLMAGGWGVWRHWHKPCAVAVTTDFQMWSDSKTGQFMMKDSLGRTWALKDYSNHQAGPPTCNLEEHGERAFTITGPIPCRLVVSNETLGTIPACKPDGWCMVPAWWIRDKSGKVSLYQWEYPQFSAHQ
jgi:hypothetical protein